MKRFLIVRIAALGDVAVSSTVVTRIRAEHPGAHVTWLCGVGARELVALFGVDEIVTADEQRLLRGSPLRRAVEIARVWRVLAGRRFDIVVMLHADPRYRLLTVPVFANATRSLRHARGDAAANPMLHRFRGDEYARLLAEDAAVGPTVQRFPMADVRAALAAREIAGADARRDLPRVALVPGGARNVLREDVLRRWPVGSYRELALRLLRDGCEVVLVGDGNDTWVRPDFAGLPVRDEIGMRSLTATLSLLKECDVAVTHDTGPIHFARLVRTPLVALFGPTIPRHVVGEGEDITSLWGGAHLSCRPCYDGHRYAACSNNLCMQDIGVDAVHAAVMQRVGGSRLDSPSGTGPALRAVR